MKKCRFLALLTASLLLLSACSGAGKTYTYDGDGHTHIYGAWYDIQAVTCLEAGEHICYCKICGAAVVETVPVADEISAKAHTFDDTVVEPTESQSGYTRRVCRLCGHVVERANETPARYSLILPQEPSAPVAGAPAQLAFGTVRAADTQQVPVYAAANTGNKVSAVPALHLATALVTAEAVRAGELSLSDEVTITSELLSGRENPNKYRVGTEVRVAALIEACLKGENEVAVAALSAKLSGSDNLFVERLNGRMATLGLQNTSFSALTGAVGETTLFDSGVLLWRALEEPVLSEKADLGYSFAGAPCAVLFEATEVRLSAVRDRTGTGYVIAVLAGDGIPENAESTFYNSLSR